MATVFSLYASTDAGAKVMRTVMAPVSDVGMRRVELSAKNPMGGWKIKLLSSTASEVSTSL